MTEDIAKETSELLAVAKQVVKREFGQDFVTAHPEVVASIFQGIASIEQAKAMEQLGKDICAAAAHARGE
jgi:hemoglobin-like flavoprotein